jgi:hypothetical protein
MTSTEHRASNNAHTIVAQTQTDEQLIAAVKTALQGKAELGASLRQRLREISTLQSRIQEIQHWVKVMRNAQEQKENQFSHLEKVKYSL